MAEQFVMPKLGLTMESGTVIEWLVPNGAEVTPGQPLMLIETDKVESEVESTTSGVLHQVAAVGEEYACADLVGWFLAPGEEPPQLVNSAAPSAVAAAASALPAAKAHVAAGQAATLPANRSATGRLLASPNAKRIAKERGIEIALVSGSGPGGRITSEDVTAAAAAGTAIAPASGVSLSTPAAAMGASGASAGVVLATVAGRQLADLLGVDIAAVPSQGPDPRVGRDDVAAYVRHLLAAQSPEMIDLSTGAGATTTPAFATLAQEPTSMIAMRGMRGTIADRMSDSLNSMAQLTLHMDVDMDAVVADRTARKAAGAAPGYTDYVIAAVARALRDHPAVNSQITADGVALLPDINVGLAVALDDGLIVPVVHGAADCELDSISAETTRLAEAARNGKLKLNELEGGTFSVTALGMFDVDGFTPIINAPNTAILGVGRLRDDVAWDDGQPVRVSRLTLSLTWDHRAFDGAPAADFTRSIKQRLESLDV